MSSTRWQILDAVRTLLLTTDVQAALGEAAGIQGVPVLIRKRLRHEAADEQVPQVILAGLDETLSDETTGAKLLNKYPVLVALVLSRDLREEDARAEADLRQVLRETLFVTTLAGVAAVRNVDYDPTPAFDAGSWGDVYSVSAQRFDYLARESRNG